MFVCLHNHVSCNVVSVDLSEAYRWLGSPHFRLWKRRKFTLSRRSGRGSPFSAVGEARESSTTCITCSHDHTTVVEVVTPKSISVQFLTDGFLEKKLDSTRLADLQHILLIGLIPMSLMTTVTDVRVAMMSVHRHCQEKEYHQ